jgi:hypothetical protein
MAVFSVGHPGPIAMFKELRAAGHAVKHPGDRGPAQALVDEISKAAGSDEVQEDMHRPVKSVSKEQMRKSALEGLEAAGNAIAQLPDDETDAVVGWIVDVGRAAAEVPPDRHEKQKVSDAEAEMLATIEQVLRKG